VSDQLSKILVELNHRAQQAHNDNAPKSGTLSRLCHEGRCLQLFSYTVASESQTPFRAVAQLRRGEA
jgi:hypothetical protein